MEPNDLITKNKQSSVNSTDTKLNKYREKVSETNKLLGNEQKKIKLAFKAKGLSEQDVVFHEPALNEKIQENAKKLNKLKSNLKLNEKSQGNNQNDMLKDSYISQELNNSAIMQKITAEYSSRIERARNEIRDLELKNKKLSELKKELKNDFASHEQALKNNINALGKLANKKNKIEKGKGNSELFSKGNLDAIAKNPHMTKLLLQDPQIPKEIRKELSAKTNQKLSANIENFASRMKKRFKSLAENLSYNTNSNFTKKTKEETRSR